MTRLEMVERVKEKTGVTYDEAHEALKANDWDVIDATLALERAKAAAQPAAGGRGTSRISAAVSKADGILRFLCSMIKKGESIRLEIVRGDEPIGSFSLTFLLLLLLLGKWSGLILVGLAILGICVGLRYRLPGFAGKLLNRAQDKAEAFKDGINEEKYNDRKESK